jgi:hypothetical protein
MPQKMLSEHSCGECARFKVPNSGCDNAYYINEGTILRSDPACGDFFPANRSKKGKEQPAPHKACGLAQEGYYEAIYHDGKPAFLVKSEQDFRVLEAVTDADKRVVPKESPNEIPYEPYDVHEGLMLSREDLFWKVRDEFNLFLDVDSVWKDFLAACVLLTYQQEKVRTVPYVYFVGDNESGKTVALTLLSRLCYRPLLGVTIPPADLYGYLDDADAPSTILEDEAQGLWKDTDKAKIYKAGYKQGATAPRTLITNHKRFIKYFRVFCFKACAAEEIPRVKGLVERFIFIPMVEGFPEKYWADLDREDEKRFRNLRNMLLKWRLGMIEHDLPEVDLPVKGRLKELWKPIIQTVHGLTVEGSLRRHLEQLQQERLSEKTNTLEGRLVKVVAELHEENKVLPFTNIWDGLVTELEAVQNEKTPNMVDTSEFGLLTKRQIGYRLREVLNGRKRSVRAATGFTKGYEFDPNQLSRITRKYGVNIVSKCPINPEAAAPVTLRNTSEDRQNDVGCMEKEAENTVLGPPLIGHIGHTDTKEKQAETGTCDLGSFKAVYWSDGSYSWHPCAVCGRTLLTSWKAETFKNEALWLCNDCKTIWERQQESP